MRNFNADLFLLLLSSDRVCVNRKCGEKKINAKSNKIHLLCVVVSFCLCSSLCTVSAVCVHVFVCGVRCLFLGSTFVFIARTTSSSTHCY